MINNLLRLKRWLGRSRTREKLRYRSLFLLTKDNKFRKVLHCISCSWQFEYFILIAILSSCVVLTLQGPKQNYNLNDPYLLIDLILNVVFGLEAVIKIIAHGFVLHSGAYLRNRWNIFDFLVVVTGAFSDLLLVFTSTNDRSLSLKTIRLFRVFRPLRLIAKSNNLKIVLDTLISSFGTIVHVLLFIFLIITLYAITGLELFSESVTTACMNSTTHEILYPITPCTTNLMNQCSFGDEVMCSDMWKGEINGMISFKNIFASILTIIQVITMEDWVFVSYDLTEIVSPYVTWLFFVSLILFGSYFAVDLLMGVVGNQYLRTKQFAKTMRFIEDHRQSVSHGEKDQTPKNTSQHSSLSNTISKVYTSVKDKCGYIVQKKLFFYVTNAVVSVDVITSTVYAQIRNEKSPLTYIAIKSVILCLYVVELMLINFGHGFYKAIQNGYFVFNVVITVVGIIEILTTSMHKYRYVGLSVIRALTMIEIFRYTRFWGQLKTIMNSFSETLKGVASLMILLCIVLTNYALLGNQLFGDPSQNRDSMGTFDTFGSSFLLSFVLLTGDNWTSFMQKELENSNGVFDKALATVFYLSFVIFGNFILINIFLGIIVDNLTNDFEEQYEDEFEEERRKRQQKLKLKNIGVFGKFYQENKFQNSTPSVSSNTNLDTSIIKANSSNVKFNTLNEKRSLCPSSNKRLSSNKVTNSSHECFLELTEQCNKHGDGDINCYVISNDAKTRNDKNNVTNENNESIIEKYESNTTADCNILRKSDEGNPELQTMERFMNQTVKNTLIHFQLSQENEPSEDNGTKEFTTLSYDKRDKLKLQRDLHERARGRAFSMVLNPEISEPIPNHKTLFLFSKNNAFRKRIFYLVSSSGFTMITCGAIIISSLLMAIDDPLKRNQELSYTIKIIDYVLTAFFLLEITLKSIAYGFLLGHRNCYLRNTMNKIDTTVTIVSIFNIIMDLLGHSERLQLQVFRVVRFVRMLKVSARLKQVIDCLIGSLKNIVYFLVLYLLILFVYSIIGVHLYKDTFTHCSNTRYKTKETCTSSNAVWDNNKMSFDNLGSGMTTLFVLSTMDDWFFFLVILINIEENDEVSAVIFIISFIVIISFVMLNVFISFIIVLFQRERAKDEQFKIIDKSAQECLLTALNANPWKQNKRPKNFLRLQFWKMATTNWFQSFSMLLILLNTGFLMTKHTHQSETFDTIQRASNIIFNALFTIEILIKLVAFSFRVLSHDYWFLFDTIVIFGSWVDITLDELRVEFLNLSIFRLFRVARIAQLVGKGDNLRELFNTFLKSMRCVPYIASLIALLLCFYAVLGMGLFGNIRLDDNTAINENTNFQTFPQAVLVLIRVTTLDAWHEIMMTCADIQSQNCQNSNQNCGTYFSYIYFASFVFVCSYIMTNLFLAFIMNNFVYLTHDISTLDARHIHRFTSLWSQYDKMGIGKIDKEDLVTLLRNVDPPLGCGALSPVRQIYSKLLKIKVAIEPDGSVKFTELLLLLVLDFLKMLDIDKENLRDDIQELFPTVEDELLDRILPLSYDPRIFNEVEHRFYKRCASFVIVGYYRLYRKSMTVKKHIRQKEEISETNVNESTERQILAHLSTFNINNRLPSVKITSRKSNTSNVSPNNPLSV